jgi:hypothetical protein
MPGLTVASANAECVKDECRETTFLIPFGDVWYDYILGHVELRGNYQFQCLSWDSDIILTYSC